MFAITTLLIASNGSSDLYNGILHPSPAELRSNSRLAQYMKLATPGWQTDDLGFKLFARPLPDGGMVIFPALELLGDTRARRRFPDYKPLFTKPQIESLAQAFFQIIESQEYRARERERVLTHDLRVMSREIYQNADAARDYINDQNYIYAAKRIDTVIAAQAILKMRIDALDLEGVSSLKSDHSIAIYKKVDKVVRCLKEISLKGNRNIWLTGGSTRVVNGPNIFELAPYAILDNALKYSPENSTINVSLTDSSGTRITVTSLGPKITKSEQDLIFDVGIRGLAAKETNIPGSGFGLNLARKIISDVFRGSVHVQQSPFEQQFNGRLYFETTFTINLPSHSN
ncbi:sensor histidine kinase [Blastomonas sp.]|uniref:sensor histidine kinase n=1 Tax=Blastomonas sp. TaxID=1909299 RepID=UPI00391C94D8